MAEEKRAAPRFPISLDVRFQNNAELLQANASNISKSGLFVKSRFPLEVGEEVALTIHLPNGQLLNATARIARIDKTPGNQGVGVEFIGDNNDFDQALSQYLGELEKSAKT